MPMHAHAYADIAKNGDINQLWMLCLHPLLAIAAFDFMTIALLYNTTGVKSSHKYNMTLFLIFTRDDLRTQPHDNQDNRKCLG